MTAFNRSPRAAKPRSRIRIPVGNRSGLANGLSTGTNRMVQSRIKHRNGPNGAINLRARFTNYYQDGNYVLNANSADLTVTASLEYPAGTFHQFKVNGAASFTVSRLTLFTDTDALGVHIPAGTDFWINVWADAGSGNFYPVGVAQGRSALDGYESGASLTDKTMAGGTGTTGGSSTYSASMLIGETISPAPVAVILGDSIGWGANDRTTASGDAYGNGGYLERLLAAAGINTLNLAAPSTQAQNIAVAGRARQRFALLEGLSITAIVNQWGRNDFTNGRTAAQVIADQATVNAMLRTMCDRVVMSTVTPRTTSTDGWTTAGNQAFPSAGQESERVAYNDALRSGWAGLGATGLLDAADAAETARNTGLWRSTGGAWTDDGTHPIALGAAGIASQLSPAFAR